MVQSLVVLVALGSVLFLGFQVATASGWLRDESGFRANGYGLGGWTDSRYPGAAKSDIAWARDHPQLMLTAGDDACAWAKTRPDAPDNGDPNKWGAFPLARAYVQSHPNSLLSTPLHKLSRYNLVNQAFNHLCAHTFEAKISNVDPDGD